MDENSLKLALLATGTKRKEMDANSSVEIVPTCPAKKLRGTSDLTQVINTAEAKIENSIVGVGTINITHNAKMERSGPPRSVDNVTQSTPNFMQTSKYHEAENLVQKSPIVILHVHGFPGTGKSEIVRRLAIHFPYKDADVCVKWHIECNDQSHAVDQELAGILKHLKESNFDVQGTQGVRDELEKGKTNPFVSCLRTLNVPVLIIIEDPKPSDYRVLRDFLTKVNGLKSGSGECFHVYVTSRKNAVSAPGNDLRAGLERYTPLHVEGFTQDEGLKLLFGSEVASEAERKAALRIIEVQAGTPLGLTTVKTYCEKSLISYEEYLEVSQNDKMEIEMQQKETGQLREEYGNHFEHLFRSIVRLLKPKKDEDRFYHEIWEVMSALCFLHHGQVPRQLVGKITQNIHGTTDDIVSTSHQNLTTSGSVISFLKDRSLCRMDGKGYRGVTLSFHEVIFRAVRVLLKADSGHEVYVRHLQRALFALSSVVHKDLRKTEDNVYMNKIAPQIETAVNRAQENFTFENFGEVTEENFQLWMCLCHLGEVIGIVKSLGVLSLKEYAESCLEFSAKVVLKTVEVLTGSELRPSMLQLGENLDKTAADITEKCVEAGTRLFTLLPEDSLDRYMSVVLQMKTKELTFLEKRANDKTAILSAKLATEKAVGLTYKCMENLRSCRELFLSRQEHCSVFFSERLASILHTWGRCLLYYNIPIDNRMRQKYMWFSKLSNKISMQCHRLTGVHILFENLTSISLNPIMLKGLSSRTVEEKKATLSEAHTSLTSLLRCNYEGVTFYEHGHIKEVDGTVYTKMILYRFLIRLNAKYLALPELTEREDFVASADQDYESLYDLSRDNITWIMAPKCLVYCGKYQASKGNYKLAVKCFCEAIEAGIKQSNNLFAWACYNLARAVVSGQIEEQKLYALEKCREALKKEDDTDRDLVEKIIDYKKQLMEM